MDTLSSTRSPAQLEAIAAALAETLEQIDAGELDATTAQRAYIAGTRDVLADLAAPASEPDSRP